MGRAAAAQRRQRRRSGTALAALHAQAEAAKCQVRIHGPDSAVIRGSQSGACYIAVVSTQCCRRLPSSAAALSCCSCAAVAALLASSCCCVNPLALSSCGEGQ